MRLPYSSQWSDIIAIGSPVISVLAIATLNVVPGVQSSSGWSAALITASIAMLWPPIIAIQRKQKERLNRVDSTLRRIEHHLSEVVKEEDPLYRALKRGFFKESTIDDALWLEFCYTIERQRDAYNEASLISKVEEAIRTGEIHMDGDYSYLMMKNFCHRIFETNQTYMGTATNLDIQNIVNSEENSFAKRFLLDYPIRYPQYIKRTFLFEKEEDLLNIPSQITDALDTQVERGCDIRYYIGRVDGDANFGLYGDVAVGRYDEMTGVNTLVFDRRTNSIMRDRFRDLSESAKPWKRIMN